MDQARENFEEFVERMSITLGHADRCTPFSRYCTGLMLPVARKSVEPMAAHVAPHEVRSAHQSLHHFVADAPWSDAALLGGVREYVLEHVAPRHGDPEVLIIDDTGFPKKGRHSVGVARQYCGQRGKQDNCQVAVSVSLANEHYSLPVSYQLYLSKEWIKDEERRHKTKVPEEIAFATKAKIALQLLETLQETDALPELVLADAGYGVDTGFRERLGELGLRYVVGITGAISVWPEGMTPPPPKPWSGRGRKPTRPQRDPLHKPLSVKALARSLPSTRYRTVTWREGTNELLSSRFAAARIHCAKHDHGHTKAQPEQWLLIEWPDGEKEPTKYFLSSLPARTPIKELVRLAKLRWRIERDYQELKQELGLGQFEGRSWRGFHHHASLCIARVWIPGCRALHRPKKNPARNASRRNPCLTRRVPAAGRRCAANVTYQTRSRRCAWNWPPRSSHDCRGVRAAEERMILCL